MRLLIWLILIVGAPFYEWNALMSGFPDPGMAGLIALGFLLSLGALYYDIQRGQAKKAQQEFWLRQRR